MTVFFTLHNALLVAVAAILYWAVLQRWSQRRWVLLALSLAVIGPVAPTILGAALLGSVALAWTCRRRSTARTLLALVTACTALLVAGKYGLPELHAMFHGADAFLAPLGISYLAFRLIQVAIDHHRGQIERPSAIDLACFTGFAPTFPGGPLETYQGFMGKRPERFDRELLARSLQRIAIGYGKKVLVVDLILVESLDRLALHGAFGFDVVTGNSAGMAWIRVLLVFLYAYLDLSALTDLAIGFAGLFGIRIMENFDRPLLQPSIAAFWRSWHISLSSWCRSNVYFPTFGATRRIGLSLYACMLVMGLWHDLSLGWACWGCWHATGLLVHAHWDRFRKRRKGLKRASQSWGYQLVAHLATLAFVTLGYAFVGGADWRESFAILWHCLGWPLSPLAGSG